MALGKVMEKECCGAGGTCSQCFIILEERIMPKKH